MRLYSLVFLLFCIDAFSQAVAAPGCDSDTMSRDIMTSRIITYQGKQILLLAGGVDAEAHGRVRNRIRRTGSYAEVWLCSGGGVVEQGKKIGRELQRARAKVRIPDGYFCASSCTIITLGGYLRIIEDGAEFIVHAASSFLQIDAGIYTEVDCTRSRLEQACASLSQQFRAQGLNQCSAREFKSASKSCNFFAREDNRGGGHFHLKTEQLIDWQPSEATLRVFLDSRSSPVEWGHFDLLRYFQEMLLDGQTNHINQDAYTNLFRQFASQSIFSRGSTERLDLGSIAAALAETNNILEERVIWQEAFTQTELTAQDQLVTFLRPHAHELGPAGTEALDIYEATLDCRIQALCYLAGHQAAALGYHNYNEDN